MPSLTSHLSYFNNNKLNYFLKSAVLKAGGSQTHLDLFEFLLKPSILGTLKAQTFELHDCRAPASLLFLFPVNIQIALALLLNQREKEIAASIPSTYTLLSHLFNPSEAVLLSQGVTEVPIGATLLNLLNKPIDRKELQVLLGLNINADIFNLNLTLRDRLNVVFSVFNYSSSFAATFIDIAVNNDRLTASIYLAQRLNYSMQDTQNITSIVELWQLEKSYI